MTHELPWIVSVADLASLQRAAENAAAENARHRAAAREAARALENPEQLTAERLQELEAKLAAEDERLRTAPIEGRPVRVADVRWSLDGRSGEEAYEAGHIPGAVFVDLDFMLAAPASPEEGRHPLPMEERFAAAMEISGIAEDTLVIAYDDASGASASRLVWLLRATGHQAAVLDGGLPAWVAAHGEDALEAGPDETEPEESGAFAAAPFEDSWLADIDETQETASSGGVVLDARAPQRYRGEEEPVDPRAGHIPGARNLFHRDLIDEHGLLRTPEQIRARLTEAGVDPEAQETPIVYCGSGVTATHEIVALASAGVRARLYPGSWSQYSATDRPAATD